MMRSLLAALLVSALFLPVSAPAQTKSKAVGKPKALAAFPGYKKQVIHGFTLLVDDETYRNNNDKRWARKPLDVLELELGTVVRRLPDRTVKVLQKLIIWVQWELKDDPDIGKAVARFVGVRGNPVRAMIAKGSHPLKANTIDVINMKSLTREHQPGVKLERCVLLHEMAHAVHISLFGPNNPSILAAYDAAMARNLYDNAKDVYGRTLRRPYATANDKEYFAELSCAYLDKLHYFPFTSEDLKQHDPQGYKVMEATWGTRKVIDAAVATKRDKQALARYEQAQRFAKQGKKRQAIAVLTALLRELPDSKSASAAKKLLEKLESPDEPPKE